MSKRVKVFAAVSFVTLSIFVIAMLSWHSKGWWLGMMSTTDQVVFITTIIAIVIGSGYTTSRLIDE